MLRALSRAEVLVPRSGETWRDPSSVDAALYADVCSAARDTGLIATTVNVTDRSDESVAESPLRVLSGAFTTIAGGHDTTVGLLGGSLPALSIRRDARKGPVGNPAMVPRGGL